MALSLSARACHGPNRCSLVIAAAPLVLGMTQTSVLEGSRGQP